MKTRFVGWLVVAALCAFGVVWAAESGAAGRGRCVGMFVGESRPLVAGVNAGVHPLGVYRVWDSGQVEQLSIDMASQVKAWVRVEDLGGQAAPVAGGGPGRQPRPTSSRFLTK